jgi:hypothetical protein
MSIVAMNAVLDSSICLTQGELAVLVVLAQHADDQGGRCWPSQATIARKARATTRGVRKILDRLERRGLVQIIEPPVGTRSARYSISLGLLATAERGSSLDDATAERGSSLDARPISARAERHDTVERNGATSRPERSSPDQLDQSFNRPEDQPAQAPVLSQSRIGEGETSDAVPFRVYAAIVADATQEAARDRQSHDDGHVIELAKRICARQGKPYDSTLMTKALSAYRVVEAKRNIRSDVAGRRSCVPVRQNTAAAACVEPRRGRR